MPGNNVLETGLAQLIYQNTAFANIGNTAGLQPSGVPGSFYISLHTADPTSSGLQNANEATYTGYARVAVVRSSSGWTVAGNQPTTVSNAAAVTFPAGTAGSGTATFFGIGVAASGATQLTGSGALTSSLVTGSGVTPSFAIGALTATIT